MYHRPPPVIWWLAYHSFRLPSNICNNALNAVVNVFEGPCHRKPTNKSVMKNLHKRYCMNLAASSYHNIPIITPTLQIKKKKKSIIDLFKKIWLCFLFNSNIGYFQLCHNILFSYLDTNYEFPIHRLTYISGFFSYIQWFYSNLLNNNNNNKFWHEHQESGKA